MNCCVFFVFITGFSGKIDDLFNDPNTCCVAAEKDLTMMKTENELSTWLLLSFIPKFGIHRMKKLVSRYSLEQISHFGKRDWQRLNFSNEQCQFIDSVAPDWVRACRTWRDLHHENHIVAYLSPNYPALLKEIPSAPPVLFVQGKLASLAEPQVAIVGSRNASVAGQQHSYQFAADLSKNGLAITSGLALGIDGYAHDGALKAKGKTIAVLGSGLDNIYPARHKTLAQRILCQGALVSEFPPWIKPRAEHFPRRNRIISGLSVGVLIVEAAEKSGSLITARYALEQNRDVFVIPGSINQPNCRGSNELIRDGACLIQSTQQLLNEVQNLISWSNEHQKNQQVGLFDEINCEEELPFSELLANVGGEPTPVDILATRTHIPVHEITTQLLELELLGYVVAVSGGYIRNGRG